MFFNQNRLMLLLACLFSLPRYTSSIQSARVRAHLQRLQKLHAGTATPPSYLTKSPSESKSTPAVKDAPFLQHPPRTSSNPPAAPPPLPSKDTAMRFASATAEKGKGKLPFLHPWEARKGNPFGGGGMRYQPSMYKHPPPPPPPPPPPNGFPFRASHG